MLAVFGYDATFFKDSVEALQEVNRDTKAYYLVITEMTMPPITGAELVRRIVAVKLDILVIPCTGFS